MKKFYLALIILIAVFGLFLYKEIKKTSSITVKAEYAPLVSQRSFNIPVNKSEPIYGNPGAPITVITFADFNCKKCRLIYNDIIGVIKNNPQKIRLIWKSYPNKKWYAAFDFLPLVAGHCANQQSKFWEFANKALNNKNHLDKSGLNKIASDLNLNISQWNQCIGSKKTAQAIASSTLSAAKLGVKTVPVVFINNRYINLDGEISLKEMLEKIIKD